MRFMKKQLLHFHLLLIRITTQLLFVLNPFIPQFQMSFRGRGGGRGGGGGYGGRGGGRGGGGRGGGRGGGGRFQVRF